VFTFRPESVFTIKQYGCSRSTRIGVHVAPEYAIESIQQFGVAYFKTDWLILTSNHCLKHNLVLDKVTANKDEKALNPLLKILAGRYAKSPENYNVIQRQSKSNGISLLREALKNSAPCLWQETISFIQSFIVQLFNQYELRHLRGVHKRICNIIMTPKRKLKHITWSDEVSLVGMMDKAFKVELRGFLSKNALPLTNLKVMSDATSIKYRVNKIKNAKCDTCIVAPAKCLNSLKIEFVLKDGGREKRLVKETDLNMLHQREYKFQIIRE